MQFKELSQDARAAATGAAHEDSRLIRRLMHT
jgi:hypothetical protein